MRAAGSPGAAPQRRPPTSISTITSRVVPTRAAAASSSTTPAGSSTHTPTVARRASAASRSSLASPATSLVTSTSPMPPSTITSASDTFWQHTPTAPSATCLAAMSGDLWVLAFARSRTPAAAAKSARRLRLRSKASRSMTRAGVSTCASAMPGAAGWTRGMSPLGGLEREGDAVDAVAQAGGRRAVGEHMAQVAAAAAAVHLRAHHEVAAVLGGLHGARLRIVEARPAGAALELGLGNEQRLSAAGALERAGPLLGKQRAAARRLGAVLAHDVVLLRREQLAPLRVGVGYRVLLG